MRPIIVIGAGIAGLSVARNLQRFGKSVILIDPLPSPGGASFGNGGFISPDSVEPGALPGMLRKVPKWLLDPVGPLVVRPAYAAKVFPWLLRWIKAGRLKSVESLSVALRALHTTSMDEWKALLGQQLFGQFIRQSGRVNLWDSESESKSDVIERKLQETFAVKRQILGQDDIRDLFPGIAREVKRGILLPRNGCTVSPPQVNAALAEIIRQAGGQILFERALKIVPNTNGGWLVMTNVNNHYADQVVIACGAWSKELLTPLGISVPLETERGYSATLPGASIDLKIPFIHHSRSIGMATMSEGLRVAGSVEFAGLLAPPDERRAKLLVTQARSLFPDLKFDEPRLWMGHRPSMPDSLPVLGPVPEHRGLHLCFGHGHTGMTGSPPSGRLVAEMIVGRPTFIDAKPYALSRF